MAIVRDIVRPVVRNIVYPVDSKYFNWSSWWSALISATIETAEPTHVVLTFPSAKVLVSTDITATVNGVARVVSSASWTGVVWTVVLDSAVTVFDSIIVTFVKTGQTQAVTNNVEADGNTVAWFPFDTDYIIKDGANRVSQWTDKTGLGHHLPQANGADQPLCSANGVLFDGVSEFLKAATFAYEQPEMFYLLLKQVTWTNLEIIVDGDTANKAILQQTPVTPGLIIYGRHSSASNSNLAVDTFGIIRILFAGANSTFQIDETARLTGDYGTADANGFTLGAAATGLLRWTNIEVKEVILRKAIDDAATQTQIYNYLKNTHGL